MAIAARVEPAPIAEQLERSYIDYAMSVIVGRALPYVQDGLKPVQRRILWAMLEAGLRPDRAHRKCAAVIGDVLKKYHPHGDQAVYDALVRMGQPWNVRVPLIDKQGNFGSIDGDPPAAYRYTEARLSEAAMVLLEDIDRGTVDFQPNFDEEEEEPVLLPARFPNLLVNGADGIAVGMATKIPPHNLGEVIDGVVAYIDNPEITSEGLMEYIKGPDFPTGGSILGTDAVREAYTTGRGSIRMRAKVAVEEGRRGGMQLAVTEIPYQVNKATLAKKVQDLADVGRLKEVSGVRDESDRSGIRLVIELRRDANPQVALNKLYKNTQLQDSFGVILLALVDGVPRTLTLREAVHHYVEHQVEVITRRTEFDLRKAEERAHIVEGLLVALRNIDEVIRIIRRSQDTAEARQGLVQRFELSELQANHILEMPLRRLTRLEAGKLEEEQRELAAKIAELRAILADPVKLRGVIKEEILDIKRRFANPRRTEIRAHEDEDLSPEQLIADEDAVITLTRAGYVKRLPLTAYKGQRRGGKGMKGVNLKQDDIIEHMFVTTTHHWLLFITNHGRIYRTKVYEIPEASRQARGTFFANLPGLSFERGERIATVLAVRSFEEAGNIFLASSKGQVKKTTLEDFATPRAGLIAITLRPGDELMGATLTSGEDDVLLVSRSGKALKFREDEVRPMGRTAQGVVGMRLGGGDDLIAMGVARPGTDLLCVTENGYGKRTPVEDFTPHHRGTGGLRAIRLTDTRGKLAGAMVVEDADEVFLIASDGVIIRCPAGEVSRTGRDTQGVRLMRVETTKVTGVARVLGSQ